MNKMKESEMYLSRLMLGKGLPPKESCKKSRQFTLTIFICMLFVPPTVDNCCCLVVIVIEYCVTKGPE